MAYLPADYVIYRPLAIKGLASYTAKKATL
jgi:hypothetical protein